MGATNEEKSSLSKDVSKWFWRVWRWSIMIWVVYCFYLARKLSISISDSQFELCVILTFFTIGFLGQDHHFMAFLWWTFLPWVRRTRKTLWKIAKGIFHYAAVTYVIIKTYTIAMNTGVVYSLAVLYLWYRYRVYFPWRWTMKSILQQETAIPLTEQAAPGALGAQCASARAPALRTFRARFCALFLGPVKAKSE